MLNNIAALMGSPSGAAAGDYESIQSYTVGVGGIGSVVFSSITADYQHLQIRYAAKDNRAGTYADDIIFRLNSDSTTGNYRSHRLYGYGSGTPSADSVTGFAGVFGAFIAAATANIGGGIMDILDYSNTNKFTTTRSIGGVDNNGSGQIGLVSGLWMDTDAVYDIEIIPVNGTVFSEYSSFALYGIK